jgi:hypothetical protein
MAFFPIKLDIKYISGNSVESPVAIYDSGFNRIEVKSNTSNSVECIEFNIAFPNKIIIEIDTHNATLLELSRFNVAGINVEKDKLLKCIEYRPFPRKQLAKSFDQLIELPTKKILTWAGRGYVVINLFNPNPFAWHLYLGNRIKF